MQVLQFTMNRIEISKMINNTFCLSTCDMLSIYSFTEYYRRKEVVRFLQCLIKYMVHCLLIREKTYFLMFKVSDTFS